MKRIVLISALLFSCIVSHPSDGEASPIAVSIGGGVSRVTHYGFDRPFGPVASLVASVGIWGPLKSYAGMHVASIPYDVGCCPYSEIPPIGGGRFTYLNPHIGLTFRPLSPPYFRAAFGFWYQHWEGIISGYPGGSSVKGSSSTETAPTFHLGVGFDLVSTRAGSVFVEFQYVRDLGLEVTTRSYPILAGFRFK